MPAAKTRFDFSKRVNHVGRADVVCLQLRRIDVNHHLAELATKRMRNLDSVQSPHLVSNGVVTDGVKLLFAESFARDRRQNHRQVCRFASKGKRPLDSRWQMEHVTRFEIDDVVHRRTGVGSGLEKNLDHGGHREPCEILDVRSFRPTSTRVRRAS